MSLRERLLGLPGLRQARAWRYARAFARAENTNLFSGVYPTFAAARSALPPTKPAGYDAPAPAAMYRERLDRAYAGDYPMLFWLREELPAARKVFDWGGHVGVHWHAYRRYLPFPPALDWVVCDVPAVARAGEELARERGARGLRFTSDVDEVRGADVVLSAGALQYIEAPSLPELLVALQPRPRLLLLNKLPLTPFEDFYTVQSTGNAFHPYRFFGREAFAASLRALGYELIDEWPTHEHKARIPLHPERSLEHYFGQCWRLEGAGAAAGGSLGPGVEAQ